MTYTFEDLKADVKKEAEALRVHATEEELGRLDFETFNASVHNGCIYGQMTSSCATERAHELIKTCCHAYFINEAFNPSDYYIKSTKNLPVARTKRPNLNKVRTVNFGVDLKYLSAIEAYILTPGAKNKKLISYLRGETETLDL